MAKATTKLIRPLRNGQITIPVEFRTKLDIDEHTLLQIELVGRELRIRPVELAKAGAGSSWARELYDLFAPVREEAAKYGEKEVDADVDKAVAATRRKKRAQNRS
jgi:bifunctional DNA-binding transcriptional regulator/antitoxin component of YhaV-PrlF toxin-antitoxin module